ncbi:uncharacterized protein [Nicotiana sylvestris]|uniref:uncharacterized protein n=1 Tax=Nicotiana sylvestris TaxID=4096 RepID=UPI00388C943F
MRGAGGKDELLMAYFSQSVSDATLKWYTRQDHNRWYTWDDLAQAFTRHFQYNIEIVPDRLSLTKIEKKPSKSFIEYDFCWREQVARVNPPMEESEMVEYFLQALEPTYFGHLISVIGKSFNEELIDTNRIEVQTLEAPTINQNPLLTDEETNMIEIDKRRTICGSQERSPSDVAAKQQKSKVVVPGVANKPIIIIEGAHTDPVIIKPVTQLPVISTKAIPWNYKREELRKAKTSRDNPVLVKKAFTEEEAEEFLRKMKVQDYSIVEQLRKTPAQISLLSLLMNSDEHRRALMKILNKSHVPDKISVNHLEKIANKIFKVNMVTFSDDELPVEGTEHNKALYLTGKCEDSAVTRVLVDHVSSANICPLSTLNKLKVDDERIHKNNICVRGFDGGEKDSVGDIVLELTIGPVEFTMEFQMVKFEWDRQEIVMHGKDNLCAHSDAYVPFIEAEDEKRPWVYQVFETVPVEKVPKGKCVPTPKRASASIMVASEILKMALCQNLQSCFKSQSNSEIIIQEIECDDESDYDEDEAFEEISKELSHFEEEPKTNLNDIEAINLGDPDNVRETKISVHIEPQIRKEIIKALFEYNDIFAWSYDYMPGLITNLVVHKLPIDPTFSPVKKKLRKFKTNMSVKIKDKSKGQFPLPNIHILIDNCAKHESGSFVDCYAGYHQILMDEEDAEKAAFITSWGSYCYRVMPCLKNAGETYMRAMETIFHDMIHKEIEVYVDDVIIKSMKQSNHVRDLRKFFQRLREYNLKSTLQISQRGIELDPSKIKAIQELPPPKNKTEVMSVLGRMNYISRFIAQLTTTCEPIFKLLKKDVVVKWTDECQEAFDKIKEYLSNPPVLVLPEPERLLILYLTILDNSYGCVLDQHDITGKKEQAIYYLSKKFTS